MAVDTPDFLQLAQLAAPASLGVVQVAVGQTVGTLNVTLSPFATAIVVVPISGANVQGVSVSGGVSGIVYININKPLSSSPGLVAPVTGNTDNPLTVAVSISPVNPGPGAITAANVYQLFGTGLQQVTAGIQQPLFVQEIGAVGQVSVARSLTSIHLAQNMAAAASVTLVAGQTNEILTVYAYDIIVGPVAGAAGLFQATFEDTTAAVIVADPLMRVTTAVGALFTRGTLAIPFGLALPIGAGLKVVAAAGNAGAIDVRGQILYAFWP